MTMTDLADFFLLGFFNDLFESKLLYEYEIRSNKIFRYLLSFIICFDSLKSFSFFYWIIYGITALTHNYKFKKNKNLRIKTPGNTFKTIRL